MIRLRWTSRLLASALHATEAASRGLPLAQPTFAEQLQPAAWRLEQLRTQLGWQHDEFWQPLIAASLADEDLGATMARFSQGLHEAASRFVPALREAVQAAMDALDAAVPQWPAQMPYRQRPLLEQWEARGPGLMRLLGQWLGQTSLSSVDLVLVYPVLGGGGDIHTQHRAVRLEAVLTNNVPQLPEVVRLSWLLARLEVSQTIEDQPAARMGLALAALQAAEQVELAPCDQRTWLRALESWHVATRLSLQQAQQVWDWWLRRRSQTGCGMAAIDELRGILDSHRL